MRQAHDRPEPRGYIFARPGNGQRTVPGKLMDAEFLLVICTCPDDGAATAVSTALVEERLAACVNRISGVRSRYRWQGHVETDDEVLLLIKTRVGLYAEVEQAIHRLHPGETPEVIAIDLAAGASAYLDWIRDSVK